MHPTLDFWKKPGWWVSNHFRILTQSVQAFPRSGKGAHPHVYTSRCNPLVTFVICIATCSPNESGHYRPRHSWVIHSLAKNFDTLHMARTTYEGDPQNEPNPTVNNFEKAFHSMKTNCKSDTCLVHISLSKIATARRLAGRSHRLFSVFLGGKRVLPRTLVIITEDLLSDISINIQIKGIRKGSKSQKILRRLTVIWTYNLVDHVYVHRFHVPIVDA